MSRFKIIINMKNKDNEGNPIDGDDIVNTIDDYLRNDCNIENFTIKQEEV